MYPVAPVKRTSGRAGSGFSGCVSDSAINSPDASYRRAANAVSALLNIAPRALGHRNQVPHAQRNSACKSEQSEKPGI